MKIFFRYKQNIFVNKIKGTKRIAIFSETPKNAKLVKNQLQTIEN